MPLPPINPPLVNSAVSLIRYDRNPWATTEQDLKALFDCPYTGAVTTRTSLLQAFAHDDAIHQYAFFNPQDHSSSSDGDKIDNSKMSTASLNTLGYSPIPLATYLSIITKITTTAAASKKTQTTKPFIISITGSPTDIAESYRLISTAQLQIPLSNPLCIEINLSCPNIPDKPPPAYSKTALLEYLNAVGSAQRENPGASARIAVGLKTPPYTYADQFHILISAVLEAPQCEISFLTATNTLGSSLLLQHSPNASYTSTLSSASGQGIGGLAGTPLHPLALGNVKTLRGLLDSHEELRSVQVIGVGGVGDSEGFARMRAVGASVVGVGTALGREGTAIFGKIFGGGRARL